MRDVASFLRNDEDAQYDLLVDVYGTDRLKLGQSPRFAVNYELYSIPKNNFIRLIAEAPDPGQNGNGSTGSGKFGEALPKVASVTDIWPTANWLERETYDLMGIEFENHPWLQRIMMPDNWVGHPLRKDYPVGGEPVSILRKIVTTRVLLTWASKSWLVPLLKPNCRKRWMPKVTWSSTSGPHHPATHGVLAFSHRTRW